MPSACSILHHHYYTFSSHLFLQTINTLRFTQGEQMLNPVDFPWSYFGGSNLISLGYFSYSGVADPEGFFDGLYQGIVP